MRVIPRLAQRAEGPLKRSIACARQDPDSVTGRLPPGGSLICNCEVPRRLRGSG
jgi:hypothetical protein